MENIFILGLIIEMRFILKEDRPIKDLIKEGLQIYLSSILALYIATQFDIVQLTSAKVSKGGGNVSVFVDNPDF
jgi:hypothetical protein